MAFQLFKKEKDMVDNSDTTENIEVNGNDSTQEKNNDDTDKEEEKVAESKVKKYMYAALDKEGNVITNQRGEYFTTTVEDGSSPKWLDSIYSFTDEVLTDENLRVEVPVLKRKDKAKDKAKKELDKLVAEHRKQKEEKALAAEKAAKESEVTVQPEQKTAENIASVEPVKENAKQERVSDSKKEDSNNTSADEKDNKKKEDAPVEKQSQKEEKPIVAEKTETDTVAAIDKMGQQLNGDINDAVEDLIETMGANNAETISTIKSCVESQGKRTAETAMRAANEASKMIVQKTQENTDTIIRSINDAKKSITETKKNTENIISLINDTKNDTKKNITETQAKFDSMAKAVGKRVNDVGESIEGIEGTLHRLDQLDIITELLQSKGLTMSMEIPPINADEEDIINLVRYSQKITEQLGYAARDLIRKQEAFKSQEEGNANEQKMMEQKIAKAHGDGVIEGKKAFVKQLISKYEDIDAIRESDNNHIHVIWTLLTELGVVVDGEGYYEKGREIDFSDADIEKLMGTYSKLDGAGKYKVVKTGLSFQSEIICKAEFEKVIPDNSEDKSEKSASENNEVQNEREDPASNEMVEGNDAPEQSSNE